MNERLLILAAVSIAHASANIATIGEARSVVNDQRDTIWNMLRLGGTFPQIEDWKRGLADCDAWLAAADRLEERNKMIERFREKIRNAPVFVLSDEERAHLDRIEAEAKEQGCASNGEMLLSILERARAEHDRVKKLAESWATMANESDAGFAYREAVRVCAKQLKNALVEPADEPISDPAERAKAVAKELRRR